MPEPPDARQADEAPHYNRPQQTLADSREDLRWYLTCMHTILIWTVILFGLAAVGVFVVIQWL